MSAQFSVLEDQGTSKSWLGIGRALGVVTVVLAAYAFFLRFYWSNEPIVEALVARQSWPIFVVYLLGLGLAAWTGPRAIARSQLDGATTTKFSLGSVAAALGGVGMSFAIGDNGIGGETMHFYWCGLGLILIASIAMSHWCVRLAKPLAVRDWTVYAYAMILIPLTLVPSLPLWPMFFELDAGETLMTAATSSFAGHFLAAHYAIFERLDQRVKQ